MKKLFLVLFLTLVPWVIPETVQAQNDEPPKPKPPYIAPVPDYGHWTVTFKYTNDTASGSAAQSAVITPATNAPASTPPPAAAPAGFPTTIDTIKTGELRGVVLTFAGSSSKQYTCQGNWVLTSTPTGPQLVIANSTSIPYAYYTTGFIMLDGVKIDPTTFKEAEKHNGVLTFHYKSADTDAWVDVATMLPVAVKQTGVEVAYQFLNPPPRPFPIPEDQAGLMKKAEQSLDSTRAMR